MSLPRAIGGIAFLIVAVSAASVFAFAQESILTYSVSPKPVTIVVGERVDVWLALENTSVHEADDVEAIWTGPDGVGVAAEPEPIGILDPFGTASIRVTLVASDDAAVGDAIGRVELVYAYCVGDVCYQIVEDLDVPLRVEPAASADGGDGAPVSVPVEVVGGPTRRTPFPWAWVGFGVVGLLAGAALLIGRKAGRRIRIAGLVLLAAGVLAYGVTRNQHEQAQAIGAVLCTSCVGIEEARSVEEVRLSETAIAALRSIDEDVTLTVFYAQWCHSCPYAEAMVERAAEVSDRIDYIFVDVDAEPDSAERYGIVRSGRTVVPAIVRDGSDEVVFGVENLEARLLDLLGVGE